MLRIGLLVACAVALSGCASQERAARIGYINAARAYNMCLLSNASALENCAAQKAVMDNELQVYNEISGE